MLLFLFVLFCFCGVKKKKKKNSFLVVVVVVVIGGREAIIFLSWNLPQHCDCPVLYILQFSYLQCVHGLFPPPTPCRGGTE